MTGWSELTPRQREVARRLCLGHKSATVACALGISVKTVERHVTALYRRLGVQSRGELAALVIASGWIAGDEALAELETRRARVLAANRGQC